jgi:hypothetical protein
LVEALPELKARTGVETLYNDAGFCGPTVDPLLEELQVIQIPTGLTNAPNPRRLSLTDFRLPLDASAQGAELTCPQGQGGPLLPGTRTNQYVARFDPHSCAGCLRRRRCPTHVGRSKAWRTLRFSQTQLYVARRRQRSNAYRQGDENLRAAVEATLGGLKRPFSNDQLPVRGRFRVSIMLIESAFMFNVRRIQGYLIKQAQARKQAQRRVGPTERSSQLTTSFLSHFLLRVSSSLMNQVRSFWTSSFAY